MKTVFLILLFVSIEVMSAERPNCWYPSSTTKDQLEGYIEIGLAIVSAEAISDSQITENQSRTEFNVKQVWKGSAGIQHPRVVVYTDFPHTLNYSKGEDYLLYMTFGGARRLSTNVCMGTKRIDKVTDKEWELIHKIPNKNQNEMDGSIEPPL